MSSRKEGYTLDLDTTGLIHEYRHQQGVKAGYTKQGIKPCLHPILGQPQRLILIPHEVQEKRRAGRGGDAL